MLKKEIQLKDTESDGVHSILAAFPYFVPLI